jgi:hemoglobin
MTAEQRPTEPLRAEHRELLPHLLALADTLARIEQDWPDPALARDLALTATASSAPPRSNSPSAAKPSSRRTCSDVIRAQGDEAAAGMSTTERVSVQRAESGARDLDTRAEIHDLVVRFYREIAFDELLAPVFVEVAEVDWSNHIPKLIDYWCRVLLGHPGYDGFILGAHRRVDQLQPFCVEFFDRWYALFERTVDEGWSGPTADAAKSHAARIAKVLARRLLDGEWVPPLASSAQR